MKRSEYRRLLEIEVYKDGDRTNGLKKWLLRSYTRCFVPSRRAVYLVRKMQYYRQKGGLWTIYADIIRRHIWREFGCFIEPSAIIGQGFHLPHPTGIVIGTAVRIGENVSLYQGVTLGGGNIGDAKKGNQPVIGNNVICFAGSKVLGKVIVGDKAVIAAGCILLKDAESGGVYAGIPGKRVK